MNENEFAAENYSGDETAATVSPAVEEQTPDEGFLAGFDAESTADEQTEAESDSKEEPEKVEENNNQEKFVRPDKSSRASERIRKLVEENRAQAAELAEYRRLKAEMDEPTLNRDEDGNVSVEDMAEYNRQMIRQEIERERQANEARVREVESQRDLESAINSIQNGIADRVRQYDFLDKSSKNYNAGLERAISEGALEYVSQFQAMGLENYSTMAEATLEYIDHQIEIAKMAEERAQVRAGQSLNRMRNGGAMVSQNHGSASGATDGFLKGFLE